MSDSDFPFGEPDAQVAEGEGRRMDRRLLVGGAVLAVALLGVGAKVFLLGNSSSDSGGGTVAAAHPHHVTASPTPGAPAASPAAAEPAPYSNCLGDCDPFSPLVVPPATAGAGSGASSAPTAAPAPPQVVTVPGPTTTVTVTPTPVPVTAGPGQSVLTVTTVDLVKQVGSFTVNGLSFSSIPADNNPANLTSVFDKVYKLIAVFRDSTGAKCATVQYNDNTAPFSLCEGQSRTVG